MKTCPNKTKTKTKKEDKWMNKRERKSERKKQGNTGCCDDLFLVIYR